MEINPGPGLAVCKLKILHTGRNLPGVKDPSAGLVTTQNSSDMGYDARLADGYGAWIRFDMVTNWGEGAFSNDLTTDADTVQIGAFLSHFTERSADDETYDVNHKATMAKLFAGFLDHGPHFVLRLVIVVLIGLSQGGVYNR